MFLSAVILGVSLGALAACVRSERDMTHVFSYTVNVVMGLVALLGIVYSVVSLNRYF